MDTLEDILIIAMIMFFFSLPLINYLICKKNKKREQ
jgi:hypothetical protein